ncbi:MAG TPA: hypothetical protein P5229_01830 [Candidatus Gracilibacteria bacterium]|nr:hypothetical protein [Candidatus Gracilibacteria bacterium]
MAKDKFPSNSPSSIPNPLSVPESRYTPNLRTVPDSLPKTRDTRTPITPIDVAAIFDSIKSSSSSQVRKAVSENNPDLPLVFPHHSRKPTQRSLPPPPPEDYLPTPRQRSITEAFGDLHHIARSSIIRLMEYKEDMYEFNEMFGMLATESPFFIQGLRILLDSRLVCIPVAENGDPDLSSRAKPAEKIWMVVGCIFNERYPEVVIVRNPEKDDRTPNSKRFKIPLRAIFNYNEIYQQPLRQVLK